ncbi:MAG: hypothetical protein PHP00_05705 [Thiotrichaceae bacterium]|nr:hypothetical protein [Thiotrichaceae bacterium]
MNQQLKNQIISHFAEDWGDSSPQFAICEKIFDYLLSRPLNQLKHLTPGSIQVAIGEYRSDVDFLRAIQYLCGAQQVLSAHYEFFDGDDDYYPLSYADVDDALTHGTLVHPETGELIQDYKNRVLMYFKPGSTVEKVINEH